MFCNNCGARVKENALFCGECGNRIVMPDVSEKTEALINSPDVCRNCGAKLDPNGLFCGECGTPVGSLDNSQEVQYNNQDTYYNSQDTYQENTHYINQVPVVQPLNQVYNLSEEQMPLHETQKTKENLAPLIIALAAVLIVCSCIIWFVIKKSSEPISIDIPISGQVQSDEELKGSDTTDNDEKDEENNKSETDSASALRQNDSAAINEASETIPSEANEGFAAEQDFLFPSDSELITEDYLMTLTKEEIALLRNEIFARHGYIFRTEPFKTYFSSKPWYTPNENYDDSLLSEIEKTNAETIIAFEEKMGWR